MNESGQKSSTYRNSVRVNRKIKREDATLLLTLSDWQVAITPPRGVPRDQQSNWMTYSCFYGKDFITQQEGSMNCLISFTEEDIKGGCCLQGSRSWLGQLRGVNNVSPIISQSLSNMFPIILWLWQHYAFASIFLVPKMVNDLWPVALTNKMPWKDRAFITLMRDWTITTLTNSNYLLRCPPRRCCSWCCRTPRRCSGCLWSDSARAGPSGSARAGLTSEGSPAGTGIRWTGAQREAPTDPTCTLRRREGVRDLITITETTQPGVWGFRLMPCKYQFLQHLDFGNRLQKARPCVPCTLSYLPASIRWFT